MLNTSQGITESQNTEPSGQLVASRKERLQKWRARSGKGSIGLIDVPDFGAITLQTTINYT